MKIKLGVVMALGAVGLLLGAEPAQAATATTSGVSATGTGTGTGS